MIRVRGWMVAVGVAMMLIAVGCTAEKEESAGTNKMHGSDVHEDPGGEPAAGPAAIDPVSEGPVTSEDAPQAVFLDAVYRFETQQNLDTFRAAPESYATTLDPVSSESVRISDAARKKVHAGRSWYFTSEENLRAFEASPDDYATYKCYGCGMTGLLAKPTVLTEAIGGQDFHFCCSHCQEAFMQDAEEWTAMIVPESHVKESTGIPGTDN